MNLYVRDLNEMRVGTARQLTKFTDFDVKFPSLGDRAIVFEQGGWIYRFDLEAEQAVKVPIRIVEDRSAARGSVVNVSKNVTNFEISPDGKRALFGARGEVFTVPVKEGPTRNLTTTSGVHERNASGPRWPAHCLHLRCSGEDEVYRSQRGPRRSSRATPTPTNTSCCDRLTRR
jgi:tricorn protease